MNCKIFYEIDFYSDFLNDLLLEKSVSLSFEKNNFKLNNIWYFSGVDYYWMINYC